MCGRGSRVSGTTLRCVTIIRAGAMSPAVPSGFAVFGRRQAARRSPRQASNGHIHDGPSHGRHPGCRLPRHANKCHANLTVRTGVPVNPVLPDEMGTACQACLLTSEAELGQPCVPRASWTVLTPCQADAPHISVQTPLPQDSRPRRAEVQSARIPWDAPRTCTTLRPMQGSDRG